MKKAAIQSALARPASNTMYNFFRRIATPAALMAWIVLASNSASAATEQPVMSNTQEVAPNLATAKQPELPAVGKWMVDGKGDFAHWLGELYEGKPLREPINVILVDAAAQDENDAVSRLVSASHQAGYPIRRGHSIGYQASIGGTLHSELPTGKTGAFSNAPFELDNNHGRIFGPYKFGDSFVFVAAFSRENVDPLGNPKHRYSSFNRSRDDFAQRMNKGTEFKLSGFIDLENTGIGMTWTTGDHDGLATVLHAPKK